MEIGFAFNLKPSASEAEASDEPPSREDEGDDRYAEWDDAATVDAVEQALRKRGRVHRLEADPDFPHRLSRTRPDIVFNIAEGLHGVNREAHVPAICEFFDIPYTASGPLTLSLALDKRRAKEVFRARGIATPAWSVWCHDGPETPLPVDGPWIVKPISEGSSKGISVTSFCTEVVDVELRAADLVRRYSQPALIERFLPGREFTIGVIGNGRTARALPPVEIRLDALPAGVPRLYGWEAKWVWDTPGDQIEIFHCPAEVDARLGESLSRVALDAFHALGCNDWGRVDVRLDERGEPHVIEVNPLPGILPDPAQHSCLPAAARVVGLEYDDLILYCLDAALQRYGLAR
jgi:D-alanine-D-alanine ligase